MPQGKKKGGGQRVQPPRGGGGAPTAFRGLGFVHGTQTATLTGNKLQEALVKVAEKYVADEEKNQKRAVTTEIRKQLKKAAPLV